jgi:hypothetical protein
LAHIDSFDRAGTHRLIPTKYGGESVLEKLSLPLEVLADLGELDAATNERTVAERGGNRPSVRANYCTVSTLHSKSAVWDTRIRGASYFGGSRGDWTGAGAGPSTRSTSASSTQVDGMPSFGTSM